MSLGNKRVYQGGWSREVTAKELPIAKELAGVNMRLEAGGIRELHWHKAAEWSYMLYGGARITAIDAEGRSFVRDVFEGDLWYFPTGIPHSIQGLGPDGAEFMLALKITTGGEARIVDSTRFKESTTVAVAIVTVHPGGMRELHWHQNADEWQYYISGKARMTVVGTGARARTMDFEAGDVGYVVKTLPHYIDNIGDGDLKYLEVFRAPRFEDLSLSEWLPIRRPNW